MADGTAWLMLMRASSTSYTQAGTIVQVGTTATSLDGKDSGDVALTFNGANANAGIVRTDFADVPPVYGSDKRAPLTAGQTKVWDIVVAAGSTYAPTALRFAWYAGAGANDPVGTIAGTPVEYVLEVVNDPTGLNSGFVWKSQDPTGGTSTAPLGYLDWTQFPKVADKSAMMESGIKLRFTVKPVPEPGSMLALASGIVGLAGFGIRRRK